MTLNLFFIIALHVTIVTVINIINIIINIFMNDIKLWVKGFELNR